MNYVVHILLFPILACTAQLSNLMSINGTLIDVQFYEYGVHVEGDSVSFVYDGTIPAFNPIYTLDVTPKRQDVEKRFTYLRAEYISPISKVSIDYDPNTYSVSFHIKFPFIDIPIGVIGYSMPIKKQSLLLRRKLSGRSDDGDKE